MLNSARSPAVLFVGARTGALAACARLGIPAAVLQDAPLTPRLRKLVVAAATVPPHDRDAVVAAATALDFAPSHVLALTERSVVPAAWVRAALRLPGTDTAAARRCHDKARMKRALTAGGVPVTQWQIAGARSDPADLLADLGSPVVLKPRTESGSRGLCISSDLDVLRAARATNQLAERFIVGTEMSVESIRAHGRTLFTNFTCYHEPLWANVLPAALHDDLAKQVTALNERALDSLGVRRGIAHVELFVTDQGLVVGEAAIRPPGGYLMRLIELAYGFDPWEALLRIVVLQQTPELPRTHSACAGVRILHPGAGVVRRVRGVADVRAWPETVEAVVRVRRGSNVASRLGSGQEVGHVIVRAADRGQVAARLDEVRDTLCIEVEDAAMVRRRTE